MSERVIVHEGLNVFAEHAEKWNSLLERAGNPSFFLRADWLNCWAKHWAENRKTMLVVVERNGEWIGGLPLILGKGRIGARWKVQKLEFAGVPFYDRMELPAATAKDCERSLELILQWMQRDLKSWTALGLHEVPNGSHTLNAFKSISRKRGFELHTVLASKAPLLDLHGGGKTSSKYRRQLRQSMERLMERGKVETDFFSVNSQDIESLIQECSAVESVSWKGKQGVGIFRNEAFRKFMLDVWKMLAPEKGIALATIRLDGNLIIYHWGFRHGDRFLSYNMAQTPETNNIRGGSLILKLMVDKGLELGFSRIDASRGSLTSPNVIGRYHGPIRDHGNLVVYGPGLKSRGLSFLRHRALPIIRKLRKLPRPPVLEEKSEITDLPCTNESA